MAERTAEEHFISFLRAVNLPPASTRKRKMNRAEIRRLMNWSALVYARYFDGGHANAEKKELWAKMEAFLAPFINSGRKA